MPTNVANSLILRQLRGSRRNAECMHDDRCFAASSFPSRKIGRVSSAFLPFRLLWILVQRGVLPFARCIRCPNHGSPAAYHPGPRPALRKRWMTQLLRDDWLTKYNEIRGQIDRWVDEWIIWMKNGVTNEQVDNVVRWLIMWMNEWCRRWTGGQVVGWMIMWMNKGS